MGDGLGGSWLDPIGSGNGRVVAAEWISGVDFVGRCFLVGDSQSEGFVFGDFNAERGCEFSGKRAIVNEVRFIFDARATVGQEDAAAADIVDQLTGNFVGEYVQVWGEDQFVAADVVAGSHDVDVHTGAKKCFVVALDGIFVRRTGIAGLKLQRPDAVVIVKDGDLGMQRSAGDVRSQLPV